MRINFEKTTVEIEVCQTNVLLTISSLSGRPIAHREAHEPNAFRTLLSDLRNDRINGIPKSDRWNDYSSVVLHTLLKLSEGTTFEKIIEAESRSGRLPSLDYLR